MKQILIVEDDNTIQYALSELLREEGFGVSGAFSLQEAEEQDLGGVDLVLLDLGLPDGEGWDFLNRKRCGRMPPVIILTAREDEEDIIRGLDMGADDYVTKPFKSGVLLSRIRAVLRRGKNDPDGQQEQILICGNILLDKGKTVAFAGEKELALTAGEFRLLQYLMENRNITITRGLLLAHFWDSAEEYVNDNTLSVMVKRLREKLGEESRKMLKTVRGIGYKMEDFND